MAKISAPLRTGRRLKLACKSDLTAISTPPPFFRNFDGLDVSGGWDTCDLSLRNIE